MKLNKKLLQVIVSNTLTLSYEYLKKTLYQYNLELPNNIDTEEKYITELNKYKKSIKEG